MPDNAAGLQSLLRCSTQWAYKLTEAARTEIDLARDAEIAERKTAGQSNRAIARDLGVDRRTIDRAETGAEFNSGKMPRLPEQPASPHPAQAEFDDMTSARSQRWGIVMPARTVPKIAVCFPDTIR